jgi:hypothetical protein
MQENLFPRQEADFQEIQLKILKITRRNIKSIFEGVSRLHKSETENDSLVTVRVRHFNDVGPDQASIKQDDGPSLLFYYLFDDWMSSFGLVAKREHKYSVLLEKLVGPCMSRRLESN